ncbi:hypothetical protein B0H10DRAFT_1942784 [Mycena sp. CBHHK59/15]|nr:hypothetical protein B0H10DRAFT_1942784 [Mycena sp. CBHHK59/15]
MQKELLYPWERRGTSKILGYHRTEVPAHSGAESSCSDIRKHTSHTPASMHLPENPPMVWGACFWAKNRTKPNPGNTTITTSCGCACTPTLYTLTTALCWCSTCGCFGSSLWLFNLDPLRPLVTSGLSRWGEVSTRAGAKSKYAPAPTPQSRRVGSGSPHHLADISKREAAESSPYLCTSPRPPAPQCVRLAPDPHTDPAWATAPCHGWAGDVFAVDSRLTQHVPLSPECTGLKLLGGSGYVTASRESQ